MALQLLARREGEEIALCLPMTILASARGVAPVVDVRDGATVLLKRSACVLMDGMRRRHAADISESLILWENHFPCVSMFLASYWLPCSMLCGALRTQTLGRHDRGHRRRVWGVL